MCSLHAFTEALRSKAPASEVSSFLGEKWPSKDNLLQSDGSGDPTMFVALYDYSGDGEKQLQLLKGRKYMYEM